MKTSKLIKISTTAVSFLLYVPMWWRIIERGSAGDYSLWAYAGILWIQIGNFVIARREAKWFLRFFYGMQTVLVLATIFLIYHFYD